MQKTLEELGREYLESAKQIEIYIKKYREILKEAYDSGNYLKTYDAKRKLMIFYDQKLIKYYNKEDNSDELHKDVG